MQYLELKFWAVQDLGEEANGWTNEMRTNKWESRYSLIA